MFIEENDHDPYQEDRGVPARESADPKGYSRDIFIW